MELTKNFLGVALLSASFSNFAASEPAWVKDGKAYVTDGELTIKRSNGLNVNVSLNQSLPVRKNQGRTPNIMVIGSSDGYAWSHGFKMTNNDYFIYESKLDTYIKFSRKQMDDLFDYDEVNFIRLNSGGNYSWPSNRAVYSATFTCGNSEYTGSCRSSGRVTSGNGGGSFQFSGSFDTGFAYTVSAFSDGVSGSFSIPETFQDVFNPRITGSASGYSGVYGQCSDKDGSGATCSRSAQSTSSLSLDYLFVDSWYDSGVRVGAYRWNTCCANGSNVKSQVVIGDYLLNRPSFQDLWLSKTADQVVYLSGSDLYSFSPGKEPILAMEKAGKLPISAVIINGALGSVGSTPP